MNIFKSILGICDTKQAADNTWEAKDGKVTVDVASIPELNQAGGAAYLKGEGLEHPVLVFKVGNNEFYAYRSKCAHGGRKIDPIPGEKKLRCCSLGHSSYDYEGKVLSGPAKDNLVKYETELAGDKLIIKIS